MEASAKLPLHKVVPLFTLPDKHGQELNLAKRRGREHLLLIMFRASADTASYLGSVAAYADEWRQLPARGIVVSPSTDAAGALGSLPFTLLVDDKSRVIDRFLSEDAVAGVFALDRYGSLYQQWVVADQAQLPAADEINGWMQAISMQCSI
jgi:peroxiredoxin